MSRQLYQDNAEKQRAYRRRKSCSTLQLPVDSKLLNEIRREINGAIAHARGGLDMAALRIENCLLAVDDPHDLAQVERMLDAIDRALKEITTPIISA